MSGYLVHARTTVQCAHAGQAMPTRSDARVRVGGFPVIVAAVPYTILGCSLPTPCASEQWISGATKVRVGGVPVLLSDSRSVCTPTGTALTVLPVQSKVRGV